jgi:hypothetical protein
MDIPEEELDIELTEQPPTCRYVGRRATEPCWGPVEDRPSITDNFFKTCVGHSCTVFNGRYYQKVDLLRARKTGGRLYPTFQPLASAPLPEVDPELVGLWHLQGDGDRAAAMNRATREAEVLRTVTDAYSRFKSPRAPRDIPPPPSAPLKPVQGMGVAVAMGSNGDRIEPLKEVK